MEEFATGATVYHREHERTKWRQTRVDKVYANGNFVLEGDQDRRQWRPFGAGYATRASRGGGRWVCDEGTVLGHTEANHARVVADNLALMREQRLAVAMVKLVAFKAETTGHTTKRMRERGPEVDAFLDALEAALAKVPR